MKNKLQSPVYLFDPDGNLVSDRQYNTIEKLFVAMRNFTKPYTDEGYHSDLYGHIKGEAVINFLTFSVKKNQKHIHLSEKEVRKRKSYTLKEDKSLS